MNKAHTYPLPEDFIRRIKNQFGDESANFLDSLENDASTSVRINRKKMLAIAEGIEQVPWCKTGYFLEKRPIFTLDPLIHAGAYYVQESSSMFLEQAFNAIDLPGDKIVLDLCGAPGGKSTHLLSLLTDNDLLVSNEVIQSRAKILQENIRKWGAQNIVISNNDPKDFHRLPGFFDIIVIDAPCSGEGLFKRDQSARNEWSVDNAHLCSVRQRRILADIWPALKSGGYIIYSTCTFNPEENEENLKWLQTQTNFESIRIPLDPKWNVDEIESNGVIGYRFLPNKVKGEGFFISVLRKNDTEAAFRFPKKAKSFPTKAPGNLSFIQNWIHRGNFDFQMLRDSVVSFPQQWKNELIALRDALKIIDFGLPLAEVKGKNANPTHELAISSMLNPNSFEYYDLNLEEALKYLRKDEIKTESGKTGWQIVRFREIPLGFVKNLGNRANNYFPKEWRIRMQIDQPGTLWYE